MCAFLEQGKQLIQALRSPDSDPGTLHLTLKSYSHRLSFVAEDQAEIRSGLLKLLYLVFENIGELSIEDQWLKGQMDALMQAAKPPLSLRRLDDVERRLMDVIQTARGEGKSRSSAKRNA